MNEICYECIINDYRQLISCGSFGCFIFFGKGAVDLVRDSEVSRNKCFN